MRIICLVLLYSTATLPARATAANRRRRLQQGLTCIEHPVPYAFPADWTLASPATFTVRDIRSGNPGTVTQARLPDVSTDQPPSRMEFSYEYVVGYRPTDPWPFFTVGLVDVTTDTETIVYTSPALGESEYNLCGDWGDDAVPGDGCYYRVDVDVPVNGFASTQFYVRFTFTNNGRNLHLNGHGLNMVVMTGNCQGCVPGKYMYDDACVPCGPGNTTDTLSYIGATSCTPCPPGQFDDDSTSTTPCVLCGTGAFATATTCENCAAGTADSDSSPATPCDNCSPGFYAALGETSCHGCATGTADSDNDPASPCESCEVGYYSAVEATTCSICQAGYIDHDSDPTTPCNSTDAHLCRAGTYAEAGSTECTDCAQGYADEDSDPSTSCNECTAGHEQLATGQTVCVACTEGTADTDSDSTTSCDICGAGTYAPEASTICFDCPPGEADNDSDPTTTCEICLAGTYSAEAATECSVCVAGSYDDDSDAATMCALCNEGAYTVGGVSPCADCSPGRADEDLDASTSCTSCASGTYAAAGATSCEACAPGWSDLDSTAATACTACPRGQFNTRAGRTDCDNCDAGRYAPAVANAAVDACEACSPGQFASNGSAACASCAPGTADEDMNPATACSACPNGTYATCGGTECSFCEPGKSDSDSDTTTPCTDCNPGQHWVEAGIDPSATIAACVDCPPGKADTDGDTTTACELCPSGKYAGAASTFCDDCGLNAVDHDDNAATPCQILEGTCLQVCEQGTEDNDCDESTPCTDCPQGQFSPGGVYFADVTQCRPCAPGSYAPSGSNPTDCVGCPMGRADNDNNQWTPCQICGPGTFTASETNDLVVSNATLCANCPPGTFDDDSDASTPCSECAAGTANPNARSVDESACAPCAPGRWSFVAGMAVCPACPEGTYRGVDSDGCLACDASTGAVCSAGSAYPRAAAGYFAELSTPRSGDNTTNVVTCVPFPYACLGTCTSRFQQSYLVQSSLTGDGDAWDLATCAPGLESQSCTPGYEGPRCSECTKYEVDFDDSSCDEDIYPPMVNGYYRLESRCIPCPCTWIKFHHIIIALFVAMVAAMLCLDLVGLEIAEHASILAAPMFIIVSFCQTIATFLDTDIPWPTALRRMMVIFSSLNLNLELAQPECAADFGALAKVQFALAMPLFVCGAIAVYFLIATIRMKKNMVDATEEQQRSARSQLKRRMASVVTTLFTVGAIFFVKSFLRAFDCIPSGPDDNSDVAEFMESAPEIQCTSPAHSDIASLSLVGLWIFAGCFVSIWLLMIKAHRSDSLNSGVFAFLADKFEDRCYYWEMIIVARKVLIMAIFLLFGQVVAMLLATFVTIFSVCIHIAAQPFEDKGTNWTETLSLCAQCITLVAGPVFVVLNDPQNGMSRDEASNFRALLELLGGITLAVALAVSLLVQVDVWRGVTRMGKDDEHDDFKIRAAEQRCTEMRIVLEQQEQIVLKLKGAYNALHKEKADAKVVKEQDKASFENPLSNK